MLGAMLGAVPSDADCRLGVTVESLRKCLQRGETLRGRKHGERWYVRELDIPAERAASRGRGMPASISSDSEPPGPSCG